MKYNEKFIILESENHNQMINTTYIKISDLKKGFIASEEVGNCKKEYLVMHSNVVGSVTTYTYTNEKRWYITMIRAFYVANGEIHPGDFYPGDFGDKDSNRDISISLEYETSDGYNVDYDICIAKLHDAQIGDTYKPINSHSYYEELSILDRKIGEKEIFLIAQINTIQCDIESDGDNVIVKSKEVIDDSEVLSIAIA